VYRLLPMILALVACGPDSTKEPSGTTADPVEVCERVADVCRIDGSRLGVCMQRTTGDGFTCESQH
jgi:hypothetical protein